MQRSGLPGLRSEEGGALYMQVMRMAGSKKEGQDRFGLESAPLPLGKSGLLPQPVYSMLRADLHRKTGTIDRNSRSSEVNFPYLSLFFFPPSVRVYTTP